jgi:hypothetical protein
MFMHNPKAVGGRKGRGKSPKNRATNHSGTPVRMTNSMDVLRKGSRGKSRR